MTFTSVEFPLFLSLLLLLQHAVRRSALETYLLLLGSYLFCVSGSLTGTLLVFTTSLVDYTVGRRIHAAEDPGLRKRWLLASLACNLGILAFFKYANFLMGAVGSMAGTMGMPMSVPHVDFGLPPGISYFTFTGVSYVVDVYYGRLDPSRRFAEYAAHVAYFPKFLAGPIARAGDVLPQLTAHVRASARDFEVGLAYCLLGAVKKLAIADQVAPHVGLIFSDPGQFDALTLLQGAIGYSVQIYCDFSGYSDMAIGCARMMGVRLPQNFAMPYSATSIAEFWRRWHITLSNWFRDYVFLPLEIATRAARFPSLRVSANLLLTMALCGLWHGAAWTFVLWGALHGAALACNRAWTARTARRRRTGQRAGSSLGTLASRLLTLGVVVGGWIIFRAESWAMAEVYLLRLVRFSTDGMRMLSPQIVVATVVLIAAHLLVDKDRNWVEQLAEGGVPARAAAYGTLGLVLCAFGASEIVPFLYSAF